MSFDMPFYENTESKKERIMEQTGADEATVMALLGDWREETLDIEALLQASNQSGQAQQGTDRRQTGGQQHPTSGSSNTTPASSVSTSQQNQMMNLADDHDMPPLSRPIPVPTFSSANRPSVLDLTTTIKYETNAQHCQSNDMNNPHSHAGMSDNNGGASPHHSPYMPNNSAGVFNYNNLPQDQQMMNQQAGPPSPHHMMHSPHSPHHVTESPMSPHHSQMGQRTPLSPHSPHSRMSPASPHGPISPHGMSNHSGSISPHHMHHAPLSPHMTHSGSVSPIPRQHSPAPSSHVFSRYAGSPVSMASTASTPDDDGKVFVNGGYSSCQMDRKRHGSMNSDGPKTNQIYKAKRERNNIAVRKSREKKKQREAETEAKVKLLADENTSLQNKLDVLLKEMNLLKSLYKNIGVTLPQDARLKLESELAKFNN